MQEVFDCLDWLANHSFLGIPLLHLSKFAGFLVAGIVLGRVVRYPLAEWLRQMSPESDPETSFRFARRFERSIFFLVFAVVLNLGAVDVLHLPGWLWDRARLLPFILLAVATTMLGLQIIDMTMLGLRKRWQGSKSQVDEHLVNFIRKAVRIFVIVIVTLVTADSMGFRVTGAIAGLGIGGAAIALAAQGLIGNLLGTIEVVADKLYRVGDRIQFEQFDGFVQELGLRSTKIRALTGEQILVPNRKMAEVQIRNYSRDGLVRTSITVGVVYSTSHDRVRLAMQMLAAIFKEQTDVESHQIFLKNLGASSLDLEVIFWARYNQSAEYNTLMGQINLEIKRRFDEAGIEFAFPTQTLHVVQTKPA